MTSRRGVSLVELLVVIAIIGVLASLLLPAVQAAREAARRSHCSNNLHQIALGMIEHADVQGHFPTGGWSFDWVGMPDQGFDRSQPGGWVYNVLPYLEQEALHDLGRAQSDDARKQASALRLATPLAVMNCPSRRVSSPLPVAATPAHLRNPPETSTVMFVARADYAANAGHRSASFKAGPSTITAGLTTHKWPPNHFYSGVTFLRSEITIASVVDGTSNTYMVGEKNVSPEHYQTGEDGGDDESMYTGFSDDICRFGVNPPMQDEYGRNGALRQRFGSAHAGGCHMAFCDGSVQMVAYAIDWAVHAARANRHDTRVK